ncbi:hypothetical protein [Streptomyces sp. CB03911]|uniref:hypothetical protein n=1 Tax=Streptomyces sp. CB03911 TaxID=1804758 RepID=UPI00093E9A06|nr:hypothetical protein [Streptomyces sp. CB03911]OKI25088.1 hypothetical protein A6A07_31315 [Streptomyces sp. CB03911]
MTKYASAFQDPRNKVNHLEIITNDDQAAAYYPLLAHGDLVAQTRAHHSAAQRSRIRIRWSQFDSAGLHPAEACSPTTPYPSSIGG